MKKIKTEEEQMKNFVDQMRNAGVKDKTIELVLADMEEYQKQECEKALKEMFDRFKKVFENKILGDKE